MPGDVRRAFVVAVHAGHGVRDEGFLRLREGGLRDGEAFLLGVLPDQGVAHQHHGQDAGDGQDHQQRDAALPARVTVDLHPGCPGRVGVVRSLPVDGDAGGSSAVAGVGGGAGDSSAGTTALCSVRRRR